MKIKKSLVLSPLFLFRFLFADAQIIFVDFNAGMTIPCSTTFFFSPYVFGGTPPYSYQWDFGDGGTSIIDSPSHTFPLSGQFTISLKVWDSTSDMDSIYEVITISNGIANSINNASCYGICDASISLPYFYSASYSWSNGTTGYYLYDICVGTYSVTLTDTSGITCSDTFNIIQPTPIAITIEEDPLNEGCISSGGFLCASASGGAPPYHYNWSDGFSLPPFSHCILNPTIGDYTVEVYDDNFCFDSSTYSVENTISIMNVSCNGCDGSIQINSTVSTNHIWSTGDTISSIQNLCTGDYYLTITDTSGSCIDTFTIVQSDSLALTHSIQSSCSSLTGYACVQATGGNYPYTYSWSNGGTSSCNSGLNPGNYTVTVYDSRLCSETISFDILSQMSINTVFSYDPLCGNSNGSIAIIVSGGSGIYHYQWSQSASTDSFITGLAPGNYVVTVIDTATNCLLIDTFSIIGNCGTVSGHVFNDTNRNGVEDTGENGLSGITVELNPIGLSAITNQNGDYTIGVGTYDTFSVNVITPGRYACSGTAFIYDSVTAPTGNVHSVIITQLFPDIVGIDFGLTHPLSPCGTIMGYVFNDLNGSGIDDGEPRKSGVLVQVSNGQSVVTDFNGMYSLEVPLNTAVTLSILPTPASYFCRANQPYYVQTFPPFNGTYTVTVTTASPMSAGNDFGVRQQSTSYDVGIYSIRSFSSASKGTFTAWMDFKANGENTDTCRLRLNFDPLIDFASASIQPTTITGTYIEWEFPPGTVPDWYCMEMQFYLDPSVSIGTNLVWTGTYTCGSPDGCPGNDTVTVTQTVISGNPRITYDNGFNFMEVEQTGNMAGEITPTDSVFSFIINFQNTGTDTVYHLTIIDTLSPNLNIRTISTPFSSEAYKFHMPASNIIIWEFNNILLPDSATDFHHSYGFVQYNIHMKPNLNIGTTIDSRASLSFNYGEPYITNNTSLIIIPNETTEIVRPNYEDLIIYPNPGRGMFHVISPYHVNAGKVKVYNAMGAMVCDKVLSGNSFELNINEQAEGLYFVRIEFSEKSWRGKVMMVR